MKPLHIAAIAAIVAALTTFMVVPITVTSETYQRIPYESIIVKAPSAQEKWLQRLIMCESTGNPNAVNKVDRDGTPSYGLLQFKPSTFAAFSKAYGIEGALMDPETQKAIVRRMMNDPSVDWLQQFPDCVRNHVGFPPKNG